MTDGYFDYDTDRHGTSSMKWDGNGDSPDVIQLWVADMDFRTAPAVIEALQRRVGHGIFGYVSVPDSYYEALTRWFSRRHGWTIERDKVIYTSGVVPALSAIIKAMTSPGDGVILHTPAYNCFFSSIRNNGCRLIENQLVRENVAGGFTYRVDFEALEEAAARPDARLMILCNPQNPTGRVWTRDELERMRDICERHGVRVVSDEIHCELIHGGSPAYIPYATVDSQAIVCCSPSKAFNTAGLQIANIVCPDEEVRARVDRAINDNEVCDVNPFGVVGLEAAYNEGEEWLRSLNEYLDGNYRLLLEILGEIAPRVTVCNSESTYLAWVDVSGTGMTGDEAAHRLLEKARVRVSSGSGYGDNRFIRINYACPRARLEKARRAMARVLSA